MKKNEFGVFEITIPPLAGGKPAIPHNSKIKASTALAKRTTTH
jgi:1,4-alpha-glucan branching enzyme